MSEELSKDANLQTETCGKENEMHEEKIKTTKNDKNESKSYKKSNKFDLVCCFMNKLVNKISLSPSISQKQKYDTKNNSQEFFSFLEKVIKGKNSVQVASNKRPGVVGLRNHGNTCYINSVVQCLSNCPPLTNFILSNQYKKSPSTKDQQFYFNFNASLCQSVSKKSKIPASKGCRQKNKGMIVDQFATLIKGLWWHKYNEELSLEFKNQLSKMEKQFKGNYQQDSHEFLIWLMGRLHEDLAYVTEMSDDGSDKKALNPPKHSSSKHKLKSTLNTENTNNNSIKTEKSTTSIKLNNDITNNNSLSPSNSIIHSLFQAQYKSTLTCLLCNHTSLTKQNLFDEHSSPCCLHTKLCITIDPFWSISLPILPFENKIHVNILFASLNASPNQKSLQLEVDNECKVQEVKAKVAQIMNMQTQQFLLAEVSPSIRSLPDNEVLYKTSFNNKTLHCIEVPTHNKADNHVIMVVFNRFENGLESSMFGYPIVLHMHRSSCLLDMHQDLLFEVKQYISNGFEHYSFSKTFLDFLLIDPSKHHLHYYMSSDSYPLCSNAVERAISSCPSDPKHIFVVAEWYQMSRNNFSEEMQQTASQHTTPHVASIHQCLLFYTQQEQLCGENAWCCAGCGRKKAVKRLQLCSGPEVLVLHLKRFKNSSSHRSKLHTYISFPLTDLSLDKYLSTIHTNVPSNQNLLSSPYNAQNQLPASNKENQSVISKNKTDQSNQSIFQQDKRNEGIEQSLLKSNNDLEREAVDTPEDKKHSEKSNVLYDLFAVCNHFGNLTDGHYTAYCKNIMDGEWYHFDDTHVSKISEDKIVSKHAYLLFYHRKPDKKYKGSWKDWDSNEVSATIEDVTNVKKSRKTFTGEVTKVETHSLSSSSMSPCAKKKNFCFPKCLVYSSCSNKKKSVLIHSDIDDHAIINGGIRNFDKRIPPKNTSSDKENSLILPKDQDRSTLDPSKILNSFQLFESMPESTV